VCEFQNYVSITDQILKMGINFTSTWAT